MEKLLKLLEEKLGKEVFTESVVTDFKAQIDVLINEKAQVQVEEKVKVIEEAAKKDAEEYKLKLVEDIDSYLDYATKEFFKENKIAIENEFTVKAANELIEAICGVVESNHFKVDPAKNKVLDALKEKTEKLDAKLNKSTKELIEAKQEIMEYKKAIKFKKLTEGFSKVKVEKVLALLEGLEFSDIKDFEAKVKIVLEKVKDTKTIDGKQPLDEKFDIEEDKPKYDISKYL